MDSRPARTRPGGASHCSVRCRRPQALDCCPMNVLARALLSALPIGALAAPVSAQQHHFEIGGQSFLYDGAPLVIRSGEMHCARIRGEYGRQGLGMVRASGGNTACACLFWNQHEPQEGLFDFTGQNDVAAYVRLAQETGLHVILRPGPYACAEWE